MTKLIPNERRVQFKVSRVNPVLKGEACARKRGHSKHVYQERVDYLAKAHAWAPLDSTRSECLDFDTWLGKGLKDWKAGDDGKPVFEMWYPPFVESPAESAAAL